MSAQDRELLELAAKAGGIKGEYLWTPDYCGIEMADGRLWNSRDDDGDALRLACYLQIDVLHSWQSVSAKWSATEHVRLEVIIDEERPEITRRAIVRAAAEIGRGLSTGKEG